MRADSTSPRLPDGCQAVCGPIRIYLTGPVSIEAPGALLTERRLPGSQAPHLLALLVAEHDRPVGHDEIVEELWGPRPPAAWRGSLKALMSRVRAAMTAAGLDGGGWLVGAPGLYRCRLPVGTWIDTEAAVATVHAAETALRHGDPAAAVREAFVARLITARPLLTGRSGRWLEARRRILAETRVRALECSASARLALGRPDQAVRDVRLALELEPLREPGWRLLMEAYAAAGDVASALAAYERCRGTLREALGVAPSAVTRARHQALLAQTT